ncbi:MAG: type secretion protein Rhs [Bacteroidetes bacterium]|nr:type secretion protein Rhs [Bacteroidota bacterium]
MKKSEVIKKVVYLSLLNNKLNTLMNINGNWVDQRNSSWNTPYTFSGKEKDVETGYGYFGARYYDSGLSIWLSIDPMSDNYPSMSPYNYCVNNPVILVDPDGREIGEVDELAKTYINSLIDKKSPDYNRAFARKYRQLEKSKTKYNFKLGTKENLSGVDGNGGEVFGAVLPGSDNSIDIIFTIGEGTRCTTEGGFGQLATLFEEVYHASRIDKGKMDINRPTIAEEIKAWRFSIKAPGTKFTYEYTDDTGITKTGETLANLFRINVSTKLLQTMFKEGLEGCENCTRRWHFFSPPGIYSDLPLK